MIYKIKKLIEDPSRIFPAMARRQLLNWLPDEPYLKLMFRCKMKQKLDLDNPQTFNEKLQWLKLYNRRPEYTMMVDKYAVKQYVAEKIGKDYIIPTLGVWDSFDEIDFAKLPDQFVLKCTHDSGGLVICKDKRKLDLEAARQKLTKRLKRNFYWHGREWPYKDVKPRIIAEKYMENRNKEDLLDYKFMCFNGKTKCSFVCSDRYSEIGLHVTFFDPDWNIMPFERHYPARKSGFPKPKNYDLMISLAETLAAGIPFVRVDFYEINEQVYFGELTLSPGCGFEEFSPLEWDYKLGSWIELPDKRI